ncbi:hypothetical protein [Cylindrospermum stagnale]|nr:hypothetical protein [Cylindrospermum stagnale]
MSPKLLHPDNYSKTHKPDQELAKAIFTCLINQPITSNGSRQNNASA